MFLKVRLVCRGFNYCILCALSNKIAFASFHFFNCIFASGLWCFISNTSRLYMFCFPWMFLKHWNLSNSSWWLFPQKECASCRDWKGSLGEAGSIWWSDLFFPPMVLRIVCLCQSLLHAIYLHLNSHKSLGEGGKGADAPFERKQGVFLPSWEGRVQTFLWHIALKKFERLFYPYHVTMIANCELALFFLFCTDVQHVWPPSEAVRSPDLEPHLCKSALDE